MNRPSPFCEEDPREQTAGRQGLGAAMGLTAKGKGFPYRLMRMFWN